MAGIYMDALGMIEARGFAAMVESSDAMIDNFNKSGFVDLG